MIRLFCLFFIPVCLSFAEDRSHHIEALLNQRILKNSGEITCVDTQRYFFILKDEKLNETRFFAPLSKLQVIKTGDIVQVSYKKTIDGKLRAIDIKAAKEKKKGKKRKSNQDS